jgi:hypothetical protein
LNNSFILSFQGRESTEKEREENMPLKDNDLLADGRKFHLGSKKASFMAQIKKDAEFLAKLNIMDYSLLVNLNSFFLILILILILLLSYLPPSFPQHT